MNTKIENDSCPCDTCGRWRRRATELLAFGLALACGLAASALLGGCGAPVDSSFSDEPAPAEPAFIYSHTIQGGGAGCGFVYTTDPRVMLKCTPCGELVTACEFDGSDVYDVYALPGAGDGTPFGTASYVEFNSHACTVGGEQ